MGKRKRTAAQKATEKAARGRRDQQRIRDASNKSKKKHLESNKLSHLTFNRKVITRCSMLMLTCPLQRSEGRQVAHYFEPPSTKQFLKRVVWRLRKSPYRTQDFMSWLQDKDDHDAEELIRISNLPINQ